MSARIQENQINHPEKQGNPVSSNQAIFQICNWVSVKISNYEICVDSTPSDFLYLSISNYRCNCNSRFSTELKFTNKMCELSINVFLRGYKSLHDINSSTRESNTSNQTTRTGIQRTRAFQEQITKQYKINQALLNSQPKNTPSPNYSNQVDQSSTS